MSSSMFTIGYQGASLEYLERHLSPGQRITARVLALDPDEHRLSLTLR